MSGGPHRGGKWLHAACLGAALSLSAWLSLSHLAEADVWIDEATTYTRSTMPIERLVENSIKKRHIPTYFLFMHYWLQLGDDELMLRLPSVGFGLATTAMAYATAALIGGPVAGLCAGGLLAVAPLQVHYNQEARMYSLYTFAAAVALWGLVFIALNPARATVPPWRRRREGEPAPAWAAWLAVICGTTLTLYTHNTGVFFAAALAVSAGVLSLCTPGRRRGLIVGWLLAGAVVAAAYAFWLPSLLGQVQDLDGKEWGSVKTRHTLWVLREIYFFSHHMRWYGWALALSAGLSLWALRGRKALWVALLLLWLTGPALMVWYGREHGTSVLLARTLLWSELPWLVAAGVGVAALRPAWLGAGLGAALIVWCGYRSYPEYYERSVPPWRAMATMLRDAQVAEPDTAILVFARPTRNLRFYFDRKTDPIGPVEWTDAGRDVYRANRVMKRWLRGKRQVFTVYRHTDSDNNARRARAWLAKHASLDKTHRHHRVRIQRWELHEHWRKKHGSR